MSGQSVVCVSQSAESIVEIYHVLTEEELSQQIKKKTKKARKKSGGEVVSLC